MRLAPLPLNAVLCYVKDDTAYFTTQPLDKQWGDDWNDAPYEHNAGSPNPPRQDETWEIASVRFIVDMETPESIAGGNSRYSVEAINSGAIAWLADRWNGKPSIQAGTSLEDFCKQIQANGGTIFWPIERIESALNVKRGSVEELPKVAG